MRTVTQPKPIVIALILTLALLILLLVAPALAQGPVPDKFEGMTEAEKIEMAQSEGIDIKTPILKQRPSPGTAAYSLTPAALSCNGDPIPFDDGLPADWSALDNSGSGVIWSDLAGCGEGGNWTGGAGDAACASSDGVSQHYDTELRSSPFDLTGAGQVTLNFLANYQNFSGQDFLDVGISSDGGATWTNLLRWNEDHGDLRDLPGEAAALDLSGYAGLSGLILRWHYYDPPTFSGNDWYAQIDDVALDCPSGPAISLKKTVGLERAVCANADSAFISQPGTEVVYCYQATNTGTVELSRHDLADSQLGPLLDRFEQPLAPQASFWLTRASAISATTINTATWTAYNPGPSDIVSATAAATVTLDLRPELSCPVGQPVTLALADLEADNGGWTGNNDWAWGEPVYPAGLGAHSGGRVWATVLDGPYNNLGASSLLSQTLDLRGLSVPIELSWYQHLQANGSSFDSGRVLVDGDVLYDSSVTGDDQGWTYRSVDLSAYAGSLVTVTFDFYATTVVNDDGWYLDDIGLAYCDVGDLPSIRLNKTVGLDRNACAVTDSLGVGPGAEVVYCYEVTNTGGTALSLHDLTDSDLGQLLDDFSLDLQPLSSTWISQAATLDATTVNTATWTAFNPGPSDIVSATAAATVTVNQEALRCNGPVVAFEEGIPPVFTTSSAGAVYWTATGDSACSYDNQTGGTGQAACADSDTLNGAGNPYDASLWTNAVDLREAIQATLDLRWRHRPLNGSRFEIGVSSDGGANWQPIFSDSAGNPSGESGDSLSLDLADYLGQAGLLLRFRYSGVDWDWYAQVDELALSCVSGPAIDLRKTVSLDPDICGPENEITAPAGSQVTYCYEVANTGTETLTLHDLVDSDLGALLDDEPLALAPGQRYSLTQTATLTASTVNTATWTAFNPGPTDLVSATASAAVNIVDIDSLTCPAGPISGTLSLSDPLFNAPFVDATGICSPSVVSDRVYYDIQRFKLVGDGPHDFLASLCPPDGSANYDTLLAVYQAPDGAVLPFDPAQPCANLLAANDDFCGLASQVSGDGLAAGYVDVVVTSLPNFTSGSYTAVVSSSTCSDPGNPTAVRLNGFAAAGNPAPVPAHLPLAALPAATGIALAVAGWLNRLNKK